MKRTLLAALLFVGSTLTPAFAAENGYVFNEVTTDIKTPHFEWTKGLRDGPVKALFITAISPVPWESYQMKLGARQIAEWAQRGDLEYEVVTTDMTLATKKDDPYLSVFPDNSSESYLYEGTQREDKTKELLKKLEKNYDIYVLTWTSFRAINPDAAEIILRRVLDGAGLVLVAETDSGLPKMFKKPSLELAGDILRLDVNFPQLAVLEKAMSGKGDLYKNNGVQLRAYTLGKGRVYQTTLRAEPAVARSCHYYPTWRKYFKDFKPDEQAEWNYKNQAPVPIWWGQFETMNGTYLRLFNYAAGRKPKVAVTCPEFRTNPEIESSRRAVTIELDNPNKTAGEIEYRVRDDENKLVASGKAGFNSDKTTFELPALKNARYFLDLFSRVDGKIDDFGVCAFSVKPKCEMTIKRDDDRITDGRPIDFNLAISRAVKSGSVRVTLADSPLDRVWHSQEFPIENTNNPAISVTNWFIPNLAAVLRVTLVEDGQEVAYSRMTLFRPQGNSVPDWFEVPWNGTPNTPIGWFVDQTYYGWQGATIRIDGDANRFAPIQQHMVSGYISMPWAPLANWYINNQKNKESVGYAYDKATNSSYPNWSVYGPKGYGGTDEDLKRVNEMTKGMETRPDSVREVVKLWKSHGRLFEYGIQIFNLGDETGPGIDLFFGDYAKKELQGFLRRKYGTIDKLNAMWNRQFKSFDEIPLLSTGEATAKKLYPEGKAQRDFAIRNYFDVYRTIGDEIKKARQDAIYGPNSVSLIEFLDYPEINGTWPHLRDIEELEMIRTMRPDFTFIPLYGYEQKNASYPNANYWTGLISGVASGHMFFITGTGSMGSLCADYRDMHPNNTVGRLLVQSGIGTLVHGMKVRNGDVAILASSASRDANTLAANFASSHNLTTKLLFEHARTSGIVIDHFSTSAVKLLPNYKTIVMPGIAAISQSDAEAIVKFVKDGGTVVADINPGVFNEDLGVPERNPLAELFGDLKPVAIMGWTEFRGIKINGVEGLPTMQERKVGKGRAILMNCTLAGINTAYSDPAKFGAFMNEFAADIGMKPEIKFSGLPAYGSIIRHSAGNGFDMIAFANEEMVKAGKGKGKVSATFPRKGHLYECMKGFVSEGDTVECEFDPPFKFFTCFPTRQNPPEIKLSATETTPGKPLLLDLTGYSKGRVMNVVLRDTKGNFIRPRSEISVHERVKIDDSRKVFPIHFSFDDAKGDYTLTVTDVATGLKSERKVTLK